MSEYSLNYEQAISFLENRTRFGINLGLQRIEALLELMDDPHKKSVKYIHIAGTNGKGSTAAMLADMLAACGYKTGLFTSPHLHSYAERICINRVPIPEDELAKAVCDVLPLLDKLEAEGIEPPTEFEVLTALALKYFTDVNCDWAVIEVGMGGEIDSTNVILPELALITNVSMDHPTYLGNTIPEIAKVKSGIFKPGVPALTASREEGVLQVLQEKANGCQTELWRIDNEFGWSAACATTQGHSATLKLPNGVEFDFEISLYGKHQLDNAAIALAAAYRLGLDMEKCLNAVKTTGWPGRLELLSSEPMVLLDGAHNVGGMQALSAALTEHWADYEIVAVLGMLADKEREAALEILLPHLKEAVVTKVPSARAGDWRTIGEICAAGGVPAECVEGVAEACERALQIFAEHPAEKKMFLVTGSLYMLAEAREYLLQKVKK